MISKSMFRTHAKATLPSADAWYMSHTIIKDPPKSIHTRRIDKVGDTSLIAQEIDDAGDRISECILQYPRGQNPMVGTSYNNYQKMGHNVNQLGARTQAFLPYRVAVNGAFEPPTQTPTDLLPLSRMPRNWTQAISNPSSVNFLQRLVDQCPARHVKKDVLRPEVQCSAVFSVDRPAEGTNLGGKIRTALPTGGADARVFKLTEFDNVVLDTSKFINADIARGSANSKVCVRMDDELPSAPMRLRDPLKVDMQSNVSGVSGSRNAVLDPTFKLPARLDRGAFLNSGSVPSFERNDPHYELGSGKMNIQIRASELQNEAGV